MPSQSDISTSLDPTSTSLQSAWAKYGVTDSNGQIRTLFDSNNNSTNIVHWSELDTNSQNEYLRQQSQYYDQSYSAKNPTWMAETKNGNGYVDTKEFGFSETSTTLKPNTIYDFPNAQNYNEYDLYDNVLNSKSNSIGNVDLASFGNAKNSANIEITRDYDLSRFGLPKTSNGEISANNLARYDQLEYGVSPNADKVQSLMMPPVRLIGINKPRDLVSFTVTPKFSVKGIANYEAYDLNHTPVDIYSYKNSQAKEITLSGKLISRNTYEASINQQRLNILEAWTKPYFGARTAKSMYSSYLGAPPSILKFYAYGQRVFNGMPCVLVSYNWDWLDDCAIVYTEKGQPIPAIIPITVTIRESWSPNQIGNFNIADLFAGNIVKAYTDKYIM